VIKGVLVGIWLYLYKQLVKPGNHLVRDYLSWEYKENSPFSKHVVRSEKSTGYKVIGECAL